MAIIESSLEVSQARGLQGPPGDASGADIAAAINALKASVPTAGDTLDKLYDLIQLRALLQSPDFPDGALAVTQSAGNNTRKLATTAFVAQAVTNAIANLINGAPAALDTLKELADAINDDASFAASVTTALAGKQPLDATLTALAGVTTAADKLIYATGADAFATTTLSSFIRTLLDDADAATAQGTLGLLIGTNVQAYSARLATIASFGATANRLWGNDGSGNGSLITLPAAGLSLSTGALALSNDLAALEGLAGTGIAVRTTTDTWVQRSLAAPAAGLTISNNDGVSGNPTFALANDLAALEALSGTNTIYYRSAVDTWNAVTVGGNLSFSAGTLNLSATYAGQSTITTLGTIGTGTWNGSVVGLAYGGSNANLTASNGGIVYSTASALAVLAGTATARQTLQSGATGAPAWSTATYPATVTANRLLYASATNVISDLASAANGLLVTDSSGVPSISNTLTGAGTNAAFVLNNGGLQFTGSQTAELGTNMGWIVHSSGPMLFYIGNTQPFIVKNANGSPGNLFSIQQSGGISVGGSNDPGAGAIYINTASWLMRNKTSWTDGAGASTGTLTNAPSVGNPTKWIAIDDNGTTRKIPTW